MITVDEVKRCKHITNDLIKIGIFQGIPILDHLKRTLNRLPLSG